MDNRTDTFRQSDNHSEWSPIKQNCRENWPVSTCMVANVAGLCSTALWFMVLVPQLWKNFRRKSIRGLSIMWATANFTASLINIFFVFMYAKIPLYGQISSIYCPVLEFGLLMQFAVYGNYSRKEKLLYTGGCLILWGTIITIELLLRIGSIIEYTAIFLWSVETFPQIILNMRLHYTSGQSTLSAVIASTGKTTDFIATNGLVMPIQYVIMRYFSSSVAYVNGLQVAWYLGNGKNVLSYGCCGKAATKDENFAINTGEIFPQPRGNEVGDVIITRADIRLSPFMFVIRWLCLGWLTSLLIGCVIGFVWNVGTYLGLLAPTSIILVIGAAKIYLVKCDQDTRGI